MSISKTLRKYLVAHEVKFKLITHSPTGSSMESAEQAHVSGDALAKGVLVKDDEGYLLVVVPSDYHVDLDLLQRFLNQPVELATEEEIGNLLPDCELGAVPPLGHAYGIKTIWDPKTTLGKEKKVYFEAGDHEELVHVGGEDFKALLVGVRHGYYSQEH